MTFLSFLSKFSVSKTTFKLGQVSSGSLNVLTELSRKRSFKSEFYKRLFLFHREQ